MKDILDKAREQENQICVTCFGLYRILSDSNGAFADLIDTIAKRYVCLDDHDCRWIYS